MREILFRGKPRSETDYYFFSKTWGNSCKNGFVYGSLVISNGRYYIVVSALCAINSCVNNGQTSMVEVVPKTVDQYTGLTDKNGTKIFEGDILLKGFDKVVVKWNDIQYRWSIYVNDCEIMGFNEYTKNYFEVIGNMHDNSELLGGAE